MVYYCYWLFLALHVYPTTLEGVLWGLVRYSTQQSSHTVHPHSRHLSKQSVLTESFHRSVLTVDSLYWQSCHRQSFHMSSQQSRLDRTVFSDTVNCHSQCWQRHFHTVATVNCHNQCSQTVFTESWTSQLSQRVYTDMSSLSVWKSCLHWSWLSCP